MFEAIVELCLSLSDGPCRTHLLPGYESQTASECEIKLQDNPPDLAVFLGLSAKDMPICVTAAAPLPMETIAPGVFVHMGAVEEPNPDNRGDISNLGFIVGESSVLVFDAGGARWIGEDLWRAIRRETDLPISHLVLSHMHPDHIFGASVFEEAEATILGHAHLPRAVADREESYATALDRLVGQGTMLGSRVISDPQPVATGDEIDLGGRLITLQVWPTSHSSTDITAYDEATGTLFAGDLIFDSHTPALDGNLLGWQQVLQDMSAIPASRVVAGHGAPSLPWPAAAEPVLEYLEVLEKDVRAALDAGDRLGHVIETAAASEAGKWALFEDFNPRNATVAYTELEWE